GLLDERHDVAHAKDTSGEAVGVKGLEGIGLLAGAHELDGYAGNLAHGERRAAAGVAIYLGEDEAGEANGLVELVGDPDGGLAGHGVHDEEDLLRLGALADGGDLLHEGVVDVEAAGGVEDEDGEGLLACPLHCPNGDVDGLVAGRLGIDRDVELATELLELE